MLGRSEEATMLARTLADSGEDVGTLISLLANFGKPEEAIRFFEERWPSLEAYEKDYPPLGSGDIGAMLDIAYAYGSVGNQNRFDEALVRGTLGARLRRRTGIQTTLGLISSMRSITRWPGTRERALALISTAVDKGSSEWRAVERLAGPALKVLEGDAEYEAIQARMFEHLNAERKELGLEPMST